MIDWLLAGSLGVFIGFLAADWAFLRGAKQREEAFYKEAKGLLIAMLKKPTIPTKDISNKMH